MSCFLTNNISTFERQRTGGCLRKPFRPLPVYVVGIYEVLWRRQGQIAVGGYSIGSRSCTPGYHTPRYNFENSNDN